MDSNPILAAQATENIEVLLEKAAKPIALLAPTAVLVVDALAGYCAQWPDLAIVAPGLPGGLAPHDVIRHLQSGMLADRVLIFSDQLVSARHATVPVRSSGRVIYLSGVEAVLASRGYRLHCALSRGHAVEPEDVAGALRFVLDHLARCDGLGSDWRMREAQSERELDARVAGAQRELRYLESAVLYAGAGAIERDALSRVRAAQRRLKTQKEVSRVA